MGTTGHLLFTNRNPLRTLSATGQLCVRAKCAVRKAILGIKAQRKRHTLPLAYFDVSFHWDPPTCSSGGGEWWKIIPGPVATHTHIHTHTEQGWAVSVSGCGHPWTLLFFARNLCRNNLTGQQWCTPRRLNPWLLVVSWTGDCGQCDIHLHAGVKLYCSGPRRRATTLREDVEPIHEWQHQESWAGIQLHRQTPGRHRIYVYHSG